MSKRFHRRFGGEVECRFVDVRSPEVEAYPAVAERLRRGRLRPPAVVIGRELRYHGIFSPTLIQRDVQTLLGEDGSRERARRTGGEWRAVVVGRAGFATAVVRSKR